MQKRIRWTDDRKTFVPGRGVRTGTGERERERERSDGKVFMEEVDTRGGGFSPLSPLSSSGFPSLDTAAALSLLSRDILFHIWSRTWANRELDGTTMQNMNFTFCG